MSARTAQEEPGVSGPGEVDEPTFSGLAERHRRELHVHCYRMLGSFEDAEDTVQETFLRAWRRRETYEGRSTFRAWLYRIATNACLDFLARHDRRAAPTDTVHIPSKAKNKEDARKFLAFIARADVQTRMNEILGQLPVNREAQRPNDKFLAAGFTMLSSAHALAQFYDRDTPAEMAKAGMDGFQRYLLKPDERPQILEHLEQVRQRVYK